MDMKSTAILQLAGAGMVLMLASSCGTTGQQPTAAQPNPYGGNWSQSDADYVQVTPTGQGGGGANPYAAYQGGGQPAGGASYGSYSDYASYNQANGGGQGYGGAPSQPSGYAASQPSYSAPAYSPPPAPSSSGGRTYTVQKGDTLYRISKNHGTTVDAVMSANNLASTNIHPGDVLRIP